MADNKGYIKLWRNLQEWEWIDDPNTTYLWIMILLNVNWQDKTWKGISIPKGSMFTSIEQLSKLCRQTKRQTRTALKHLISTNHLTSEPTNRGTLISVVNWEFWQESAGTSDTPSDTPSDKQSDKQSDTPSDNNQRNIEYKKNFNNYINQPPIKVDGNTMTVKQINGLLDPGFIDDIYERYGDNGANMLDDCIRDITNKGKKVADLKNYAIGYMENHKEDLRIDADDLWGISQ